ncbi:allergen Tha p 1-like [Melitaea cinxia]|uniref:allergen Tha p 1-like n=1 Tax=Melitaea cinxia TaxID=113334 RepID=UPI001E271D40|nr:allergen Tha p 1-like [Melitaea cinxia]XP_045452407.1 allergen Tha p 1-like [Melitaea cinxia]XP_045452408.1 allergen Tha p 1-like [Melitaea cinxia]
MRTTIVVCFLALVAFAAARPEKYTDRFDNVNVQEVLSNRRLLSAYILCALDKGKCTNEGRELKSHIKDALENNCENCTDKQRRGARTVIAHLINHEKGFWADLTAKYDPEHKYVVKYEQELTEIKKE